MKRYQILFILIPIFVGIVIYTPPLIYSAYNYIGGWYFLFTAYIFVCYNKNSGYLVYTCIQRKTSSANFQYCADFLGNIFITRWIFLLYRKEPAQENTLAIYCTRGDKTHVQYQHETTEGINFFGAYFLRWMFWYVFIVMIISVYAHPAQTELLLIMNLILFPYKDFSMCLLIWYPWT